VILLETVAEWRCVKLCAFFLDHSVCKFAKTAWWQ